MNKLTLDKLLNKFKNNKLRKKPGSLILIVFLLLLLISSFSKNSFSVPKINKEIAQETKKISPTLTPAPTPTKTPLPSPTPTPVITQSSNSQDLLSAVNSFRSKNGLEQLLSDSTLCSIAQNRVNENAALGSLDDHAGFDKYFKGQTDFKSMGENLHWATYKETAEEIIENGWANSPGHKANMLDSKWQYGCGDRAGSYFASFVFASK